MKCIKCGAAIMEGANFCFVCGCKIEKIEKCSKCGSVFPEGLSIRFCPFCGQEVNADIIIENTTSDESAISLHVTDEISEVHNNGEKVKDPNEEVYKMVICLFLEKYLACVQGALLGVNVSEMSRGIEEEFRETIDDTWKGIKQFNEKYFPTENKDGSFNSKNSFIGVMLSQFYDNMLRPRIEIADEIMDDFSEMGFGDAAYITYFIHKVRYVDDNPDLKIHDMDENAETLLRRACEAKYPSARALTELGLLCAGRHEKEIAISKFEMAASLGNADAKIYGSNYELLFEGKKGRSYCGVQRDGNPKTLLRGSCELIGDELYYAGPAHKSEDGTVIYNGLEIGKINVKTGENKILRVCRLREYNGTTLNDHAISQESKFPRMSIYDGKIYFAENEFVGRMNMDGSEAEVVPWYPVVKETSPDVVGVIMLPRGMVVCRSDNNIYAVEEGEPRFVKISDASGIIDITDTEIIKENGTIINIWTKEKTKVDKKYPSMKKDFLYIDSAREIAYYLEKDDTCYLKTRVIGVNPKGDIVDVWHVPFVQEKLLTDVLGRGYSTFSFNGLRSTIKWDQTKVCNYSRSYKFGNEYAFGRCVMEYDRMGFANSLIKDPVEPDYEWHAFGQYHLILGDVVCVLKGIVNKNPVGSGVSGAVREYWSCVINREGKVLPFSRFI